MKEIKNPIVLGIDPGTRESGLVVANATTYRPLKSGKIENTEAKEWFGPAIRSGRVEMAIIERVQSYGTVVGSEVFQTCEWVGRFSEWLESLRIPVFYVYRKDEQRFLGLARINDKAVKEALVERYAYGQPNYGKGTKDAPGWFYGFRADAWSAYAVAMTGLWNERRRSRKWNME